MDEVGRKIRYPFFLIKLGTGLPYYFTLCLLGWAGSPVYYLQCAFFNKQSNWASYRHQYLEFGVVETFWERSNAFLENG